MLQQFQLHEAERDLLHQKINVFTVMATSAGNKELIDQLVSAWNKIVSLTYGMEISTAEPLNETSMRKEYEQFKNIYPKFKIDRETGSLQISGLEQIFANPKKT